MKKKLKWILAALLAVFVLMQLANPARTNPPVKTDFLTANPAPPAIAAMLHSACYDCHSDTTRWPWYSHIAPVSWLIASDVNDGRQRVNLSEWPQDQPDRAARRLENMSEEIGYNDMPPPQYKLIHADARLTDAQRKQLQGWLDAKATEIKNSAAAK